MFARCPECQHQTTVSVDRLRETRGLLVCDQCQIRFDALASLGQQQARPSSKAPAKLALVQEPASHAAIWSFILLAGILTLAGQALYFQRHTLSQTALTRPFMVGLCQWLGCQVPAYHKTEDFAVLGSEFRQISALRYRFTATLHHQGPFAQVLPDLRLNLTDVTGKILASRQFSAHDYSAGEVSATVQPGETFTAKLDLGIRDSQVSGYTFTLE